MRAAQTWLVFCKKKTKQAWTHICVAFTNATNKRILQLGPVQPSCWLSRKIWAFWSFHIRTKLYNCGNQNVARMLQKGIVQANIAIGARSAIMFVVTLTSNVKFIKSGGTIFASPTAKLRGARPAAKLRGRNCIVIINVLWKFCPLQSTATFPVGAKTYSRWILTWITNGSKEHEPCQLCNQYTF